MTVVTLTGLMLILPAEITKSRNMENINLLNLNRVDSTITRRTPRMNVLSF